MAGTLSPAALQEFNRKGFLIVEDLISDDEVAAFLEHQSRPRPPEWQLGLRTHTVDPEWRKLATRPTILSIMRQLVGGRPMIVQTMFLGKSAHGGRGIALHQDAYYLPHEPSTLTACWLALADTDAENGGLCVIPGSHHSGLRAAGKNEDLEEHDAWETEHTMRDPSGKEWKQTVVSARIKDIDPGSMVKLNVPRCAGVSFTGRTIHGSFANRSSDRPRPAFATHYVREGTWVYRTDVQELTPAE